MDERECTKCLSTQGYDCEDGFYYCRSCGEKVEDMMETEFLMEDLRTSQKETMLLLTTHRLKAPPIKAEPISFLSPHETQQQPQSCFDNRIPKGEPYVPDDFGSGVDELQLSPENVSSEVRIRYLMGIQFMIKFQCKALVEKFGVSQLIYGFAPVIWMRFVVASKVFDEHWADKTFEDSELQDKEVSEERISQSQRSGGTYNIYGQSGAMIWFKSLRKRIPISSSLAVSFLACHLAREPILPTDIYKWALEEKLPYLKAFLDIETQFGRPSSACPYSPSVMFKPYKVVGPRELEFMSGFVAQTIGLELPPVNFFAIANRYLNELSLPPDKILPLAARIYEWSMPPDLWLSANQKRLPSRVCVMSIILLAIRLLYNINGFGKWEESFAGPTISQSNQGRDGNIEVCSLSSDIPEKKNSTCKSKKRKNVSRERSRSFDPNGKPKKRKNTVWSSRSSSLPGKRNPNKIRGLLNNHNYGFDTAELLHNLEALLANIDDKEEYLKDLPTYLKYCQDVVFAGLKPLLEINEEERIIEKLWSFYERQEDTPRRDRSTSIGDGGRTCRTPAYDGTCSSSMQCSQDEDSDCSIQKNDQILRGTAVKRLKMNMEENGFCYIPPRVKLKRLDHLHYIRKNDNGTRSYVAHADYYILLRACARVAEVGARYMHSGALKLEKRLCWIENRVDESLHFRFQKPSSQSTVDIDSVKDTNDDIDNLNFNIVL